MTVTGKTRTARWAGALLLAVAPLPWLGVGAAAADAPGNNGTLKVHEYDTPSGTESNDPKVCVFRFEGFGFDVGQTGYVMLDGQGQSAGTQYGPESFGPTDDDGYAATAWFNYAGGIAVADGHYKATLYGKDLPSGTQETEKAKSKVFKVVCDEPEEPTPTPSETTVTPTPTETTPTPTPSETTVTPTPTPTDTETTAPVETPTVTPTETETPTVIPTESTQPVTETPSRDVEVKPIQSTQPGALPAELPKTGSGVPVGGALAASLLFLGMGALMLLGPGRLTADWYLRRH